MQQEGTIESATVHIHRPLLKLLSFMMRETVEAAHGDFLDQKEIHPRLCKGRTNQNGLSMGRYSTFMQISSAKIILRKLSVQRDILRS